MLVCANLILLEIILQTLFSNIDSGRYFMAEDGSLHITGVTDQDAGIYKCEALNTRGAAVAEATIKVIGEFSLNHVCVWTLCIDRTKFALPLSLSCNR